MSMEKKYTKDDLTVIWKPKLCIHSANCVNGLPEVFDPEARPWINLEGVEAERVRRQVLSCPSGALSLEESNEVTSMEESLSSTKVEVFKDGPYRVAAPVEVVHSDGTQEVCEKDIFLCRCGHSGNKPFCDGSHKREGFTE